MKIRILGTSAAEGIPALWCDCERCKAAREAGEKRMRTSTLIDGRLLIDLSPDALAQSQAIPDGFSHVRDLLITHPHSDHLDVTEMHWLVHPFSRTRTQNPLRLHASQEAIDKVHAKTPAERFEGVMETFPVEPFEPFETGGYEITPLLAAHSAEMLCMLYVIHSASATLFYGLDSGLLPEATLKFLKQDPVHFDAAIIECTNGAAGGDNRGHLSFEGVERQKQLLAECGCVDESTLLIAVHFSHNGMPGREETRSVLKTIGFELGEDGAEFEIP